MWPHRLIDRIRGELDGDLPPIVGTVLVMAIAALAVITLAAL